MAENDRYSRFSKLTFDSFRKMAKDDSLSRYEKIGFPDEYRMHKETDIFRDLVSKLSNLSLEGKTVVDIGSGCSDLPGLLIQNAKTHRQKIVMIDSEEMLSHLENEVHVEKVAAYFPQCKDVLEKYSEKIDVIIIYSVVQYIFAEGNIWNFFDSALKLLAPGGQLLIGDIPNISKRKRFFSSEAGIKFHKDFLKTEELPKVGFNQIEEGQIDDAVVLSLIARARAQGFNAYIVPQPTLLPMANRREDILILRD